MTTRTLILTDEEAQALVSLLDAAVRHSGLNAAETAAVLFRKIQDAPTVTGEELLAAPVEAQSTNNQTKTKTKTKKDQTDGG